MGLRDYFVRSTGLVLGSSTTDNARPTLATAVLVIVPSIGRPDIGYVYAATAAHAVRGGSATAIRVRRKDDGVEDVPVEHWDVHPVADVAIGFIHADWEQVDIRPIREDWFVDVRSTQPSPGDSVYLVGLLPEVEEMQRHNVPFVRSGTIGTLNQDGVPVQLAPDLVAHARAHLIDCRFFSGFSGSPCFAQFPGETRKTERLGLSIPSETTALLGITSGHFDSWTSSRLRGEASDAMSIDIPVHTGVGVVTPVEYVRELLYEPDLVEQRAQYDAEQSD
jgi:hypothetical protein